MKAKTIKDLKVGDKIFVVQQRRRGDSEDRTSTEVVSRVGRTYAYFKDQWQESSFHRDSGESAHGKNCNARHNGYGFDVYLSEDVWRAEKHAEAEFIRLNKRLMGQYRMKPLPHEAVVLIHEILDELQKDA